MFHTQIFVASHTNSKSPTTTKTAGRMQAEKHRSVLSGSCLKPECSDLGHQGVHASCRTHLAGFGSRQLRQHSKL